MIHPTYRRLDEPPRLALFTIGQWTILGLITLSMFGLTRIVPLRTEYAICIWLIACGVPVIGWVLSEGDRPSALRVVRALIRWLVSSKQLEAGAGHPRVWVIKAAEDRDDTQLLSLPPAQTLDFPELPE